MPHAAVVVVVKHWLSAVQHPVGQFAELQRTSQRFEKHSLPCVVQFAHVAPPVPHEFEATPVRQVPLSQQPVHPGHAPASALPPPAPPPLDPPPVALAHAPSTQAPLHAAHAAPAFPQAVASAPPTQAPVEVQHPAHAAPHFGCPHEAPTKARKRPADSAAERARVRFVMGRAKNASGGR